MSEISAKLPQSKCQSSIISFKVILPKFKLGMLGNILSLLKHDYFVLPGTFTSASATLPLFLAVLLFPP